MAKIDTKKQEIDKVKGNISVLKSKLINLMKTLAQKEYLSDPSSIFDIPQNLNLQQLVGQFNNDAVEAMKGMLELKDRKDTYETIKQRKLQQKEEQRRRELQRRMGDDSSGSGEEEQSSSQGSQS